MLLGSGCGGYDQRDWCPNVLARLSQRTARESEMNEGTVL
jgi:hypothetical protein